MGYTTEFWGSVTIDPPLNPQEVEYLTKFADTRRMDTTFGPYYVDNPGGTFGSGQERTDDVRDYNSPPEGQPGLWCKWEPTSDGTAIEWNGDEKFYDAPEWMQYLIDHFLKPEAEAGKYGDSQFYSFTFDHVVNGTIDAQGEDSEDRWKLVVEDNAVTVKEAKVVWE